MKKAIVSFVLIAALLISCKYADSWERVNVDNKFSLELPSWLKKQDDLKPEAPLQYANRFRNFYVIGEVVSDKATSVEKEISINVTRLKQAMKDAKVTDSVSLSQNSLNGARIEVMGTMDGENIYFSEVCLSGKSGIYHVSVWTRNEERKLRFKADINKIIESIREI